MTFEQRRHLKQAVSAARLARQLLFDSESVPGEERDCLLCNVTFVIRVSGQRYCSETHQRRANRMQPSTIESRRKARLRRHARQRLAA